MLNLNSTQQHWDPALRKQVESIKTAAQARKVRERLNAFRKTLPDKKSWMVTHTLYHLNKKFHVRIEGNPHYQYDHFLTDHGFCRALERVYNVNMDRLKDLVLNDVINKKEYDFIGSEEQVFTIVKNIN